MRATYNSISRATLDLEAVGVGGESLGDDVFNEKEAVRGLEQQCRDGKVGRIG